MSSDERLENPHLHARIGRLESRVDTLTDTVSALRAKVERGVGAIAILAAVVGADTLIEKLM